MDDVPDPLKSQLLDIFRTVPIPAERDIAMAYRIIRFYLGEKFFRAKIALSDNPDPYMLNNLGDVGQDRFVHVTRISWIADTLFSLRNMNGFDVMVERLVTREIRPAYMEARTAHLFFREGFDIEVRRETGIKKEDFDFIARKGADVINVEVTESKNETFSPTAISNKLYQKKDQLPDTEPSILYYIIPAAWHNQTNLQFHLMNRTLSFFARSRRINAVVYEWDNTMQVGLAWAVFSISYPLLHTYPRLQIDIDFILHNSSDIPYDIDYAIKKDQLRLPEMITKHSFEQFGYSRWAKENAAKD